MKIKGIGFKVALVQIFNIDVFSKSVILFIKQRITFGGSMDSLHSVIVTVSSKGWVVIPSLFRRQIGLKPGMKMIVTEADGKIVLTPQASDPVDKLYGKLTGGESLTEALLAYRNEERKREKAKIHF